MIEQGESPLHATGTSSEECPRGCLYRRGRGVLDHDNLVSAFALSAIDGRAEGDRDATVQIHAQGSRPPCGSLRPDGGWLQAGTNTALGYRKTRPFIAALH